MLSAGTVDADDLAQHVGSGEEVSATKTASNITPGDYANEVIANSTRGEGAAGGSSMADFDSLMQLVETTVVPDTWEALGGPSTMAPYPQGVYVDANGTLRPCTTIAKSAAADQFAALLKRQAAGNADTTTVDWHQASPMRFVSLKRLNDHVAKQNCFGQQPSAELLNLAGLSRVQYVILSDDDIVLAGPVGGVELIDGWYRDRATSMNTLRSDFLLTCLSAALHHDHFGCTIDPTPQGMQNAAAVAASVQSKAIPVGQAAEKLQQALGLQRVEVFGTAGDTPIGYVMVEADRHMKQLALGKADMPEGVKNYLDAIDDFIAQGPPNQLLLRLWFTAEPRAIRADTDKQVFEIAGTPIRLSGQNQRALSDGQRGAVTGDVRTEAFVAEFNKHWSSIRSQYPIYGSLESIYRVASVGALLDRFAEMPAHRTLLQSLAAEASLSAWIMRTPRQVDSIASYHRIKRGRQIHHVVLASGGVSVDVMQLIRSDVIDYPALASIANPGQTKPKLVQRWWWDAK
ncbi:DUF1598 domain-containing protein [Stieleria marina]|uniref:DUF1598 domain-containing protein n=1 Tax=Stieleria marina TaxID=1930275 RepID=UPI003AF3F122